jgi:hypothetical protein
MRRFWRRNSGNNIYIVLDILSVMAGINKEPGKKKERKILAAFRNVPLPNLRTAMIQEGSDRYRALYPVFDEQGDRLLLDEKQVLSEDRLRQLELLNQKHMKAYNKEPRYYFQKKASA